MKKTKASLVKFWYKIAVPFFKDPLFLSKWVTEWARQNDPGRITVWVNSGYKTIVDRNYQGELFMFLQDMDQGIMPYRSRPDRAYNATLEPSNQELEQIIAEALSSRGYQRRVSEGLEDFIRRATQSLFHYTEAFFELYCERDGSGKITKIEFYHIYPPSMKKVFGQYFQVIPWSAAKHGNVKAGIRRIPKEKILHIEFPKKLGGKRGLKKILRRLGKLSGTVIPDFQMKAMEKNESSGFDLDRYTKTKYIEIAQITRKLGWHQRKFRDNDILEYYSMHRNLMFTDSQATVREHIIDKVNTALNGTVINANTEIKVEGLLTNEDVKSEFELLQKGGLKFVEQIKRTSRS